MMLLVMATGRLCGRPVLPFNRLDQLTADSMPAARGGENRAQKDLRGAAFCRDSGNKKGPALRVERRRAFGTAAGNAAFD